MREVFRVFALLFAVFAMLVGMAVFFGSANAFLDSIEVGVVNIALLGLSILGALMVLFALIVAYLFKNEC